MGAAMTTPERKMQGINKLKKNIFNQGKLEGNGVLMRRGRKRDSPTGDEFELRVGE